MHKFIGAVEDEWQLFSDKAEDYSLGSPIGFGASSIVYAATYQPRNILPKPHPVPCALKVLDLDSLPPRSLSLLQRETTLMSLSKHPNVLRVRGSWMDGHKLHIALRLMNKGSAADVMRYGWPSGMEEDVVRCILRQALKGLNYLHINGFIHRDVKAANLLIDDDGTVLLGDLGVAADLAEDTSPHHQSQSELFTHATKRSSVVAFDSSTVTTRPKMGKRKSFVGTPCWMAPELIQGRQYDSSADIWSFGITALELSQGRPPRSRESPQKVLLKTIQDAPPTLDRDGGAHKYSRAFKEMVESCLVKDPSKRPTAEELLQTPFFKNAKKPSYLVSAILKDLPPLTQRQERRSLNHSQPHPSVDSWDFSTTATTSVYRRALLESLSHHSHSHVHHYPFPASVIEGGVFEMEGEEALPLEDAHESKPSGRPARSPWLTPPSEAVIPASPAGSELESTSSVLSSSQTDGDEDDGVDLESASSPPSSAPASYIRDKPSTTLPSPLLSMKAMPTVMEAKQSAKGEVERRTPSMGLWKRLQGKGGKGKANAK